MKVSEFLRKYQLLGEPPFEEVEGDVAFWAGWLLGRARQSPTIHNLNDARDMAIRAAEFIEAQK